MSTRNKKHARSNAAVPLSSDPDHGAGNAELGLERLVFFSDAVMAIAITLLAIDIKVPELAASVAAAELPAALNALAPRIMSFVVSFTVIGFYWTSHHRYFSYVKKFDYRLQSLNMLFLLFTVCMPFVSGLLGQYVYLPVGVVAYSAAVAAIGLSLALLWWYASHNRRLVDPDLDARTIRLMNVRTLASPLVFVVSIPFAAISPWATIVVWWLSPLIALVAIRLTARRTA
jgi:uncharacterized membrane protein